MTVLLTTHLMEEADQCDRLAILDQGKLLMAGSPSELKGRIGGDIITLTTGDPDAAAQIIKARFGLKPERIEGTLRLERQRGHEFIPELIAALPGLVDSVSVGKPTLRDVFVQVTGRQFTIVEEEPRASASKNHRSSAGKVVRQPAAIG